jgi:hypothetical protein
MDRSTRPQAPPEIVARLRAACLALPEVEEQPAWVGTRWRVRRHTVAHVLMVDAGWPPAYARALASNGPACVMTCRSPLPQLDAYAYTWEPFFRPVWFPDIVGLRLDEHSDWDEVVGLIRASYRHVAPRALVQQLA